MNIQVTPTGFSVEAFGETWFRCPACVAVDADGQKDTDDPFLPVLGYEQTVQQGLTVHTWRTHSNLWKKKEYVLEVSPDSARFFVRVEGQGKVDALRFFAGKMQYEAAGYLLPLANHADYTHNLHLCNENSAIDMWYFVPPCFVYPFYMTDCSGWVGVGLAARAGEYNFDQFKYVQGGQTCGLELPLNGQTSVDGLWESQSLLFLQGNDTYDVVKNYADWHYRSGWCVRKDRSNVPDWWKRPIFCSWGEQQRMADLYHCTPFEFATQEQLGVMMNRLDELQLDPGTIIIDDKWQKAYGSAVPDPERWPDLRAFTDAQHARGRKVVLWFRSWYPEGLDADECIEYLCTACAADPTSEKYRARMKKTLHYLLSGEEGCCNCDGFKIDFANCMPLGRYVTCHEKGVYGVELLKRFFLMMRDFAKEAKADALINCSCAHPYFDEIADHCRIHDYSDNAMRNCVEVMTHRARLARAALPDVLIDTDAGGTCSRRDFHRWIKVQPELGIPDLYYLGAFKGTPMDEEDVSLIREMWCKYEANHCAES